MAQFIINEDGLITEAAANEQAAWYVSKCPEVEPIDFESMLPQANLDELDGLEANTGFDVGSVTSKDGAIVGSVETVTREINDAIKGAALGSLKGVLDVDSTDLSTFDETDQQYLEQIIRLIQI